MSVAGPHDSPLPPTLAAMLGPLAARVYGGVLAARNRKFDAGKGVVTFDRPVISIGNLTVGGTGKTPMVSWVIAKLRSAGHDPCIAMRGYRAVNGVSDEAAEYAARFSDLPIVAQPNRIDGLIKLFGSARGERVDTIVLDDGFQHRQIARQANIVLIDARWNLDHARLLPHGWYREAPHALTRADAVVLMHADRISPTDLAAQQARVKQWTAAPIATARHAWRCVDLFGPGEKVLQSTAVAWMRSKRLALIAAIARPEQFIAQVEHVSGQKIVAQVVLADHAPLPLAEIARLASSGVDGVVMTGKDWAKVGRRHGSQTKEALTGHGTSYNTSSNGEVLPPELLNLSVPIVVPRVEVEVSEGETGVWGAIQAALAQRDELKGPEPSPDAESSPDPASGGEDVEGGRA